MFTNILYYVYAVSRYIDAIRMYVMYKPLNQLVYGVKFYRLLFLSFVFLRNFKNK